mmetsp:Transcript_78591/g.131784  ORF Transcript_78591/g.131784 Transcript_78591/m.131784 type:complete len:268 (-) Transcript_78591:269-1072(-)
MIDLLILLDNIIVLVCSGVDVLDPIDIRQQLREEFDSISVAADHHEHESGVVEQSDLAVHNFGEQLHTLCEINAIDALDSHVVVPEQCMHPEQPDERIVSDHLDEDMTTGGGCTAGPVTLLVFKDVHNVRFCCQCVEGRDDVNTAPDVLLLCYKFDVFLHLLILCRLEAHPGEFGTEFGVVIVLPNELINYVPDPLVWEADVDVLGRGLDEVRKQIEVVLEGLDAVLQSYESPITQGVDVPVVHFFVQYEEQRITLHQRGNHFDLRP